MNVYMLKKRNRLHFMTGASLRLGPGNKTILVNNLRNLFSSFCQTVFAQEQMCKLNINIFSANSL